MKTLLVLAEHPDLAEAVRAGVSPEQCRVIHRASLEEAEPLLTHGLVDACILDLEQTSVQGLWAVEKLRHRAPKCPLIIYTGSHKWEWEEDAYLQGVSHVLGKPVKPRLLSALLERLWTPPQASPVPAVVVSPSPQQFDFTRVQESALLPNSAQALRFFSKFSGILTHSLNAEAMLEQFLLLLRELVAVNRAAIFLRQPTGSFGLSASPGDNKRLRAACAIGLSHSLLEHFELSFETGLGGHVFRLARILRRQSEEIRADVEAQKEFELLGVQVAVPILDRESVLGVAVFDGRITGEPLLNSELELIFNLLEQLGLGIKNIWLHDQAVANHEMLADILRELSSACVVVSRDLIILHANKTARRYFGRTERRTGDMDFSDLPQVLGAKIFQVLRTGAGISNFKYQPEDAPGNIYNINIVPFQRQKEGLPASALLMAEDLTQSEQLRRLEIETANLRLIRAMADRLTHEIGNAMVPLSTHQQLLSDKWKDPEFRASLELALADGVKRVNRLINQMRFLARDNLATQESFPLAPLIEEAYQEACKYQPVKSAQLRYDNANKPIVLNGDRAALKHALAEVMLNALQANPTDPKIGVRLHTEANGQGHSALQIEVQDNGAGFTPEAMQKAPAPFFTTRNVGLGLGLTVSRKIVETHHGKLEIVGPKTGHAGIVRISLPLESDVTLQA
ncbi:MAG TPA: ATP-binding protein [Candidatus Limnocylindrales bacterium]|jgi:signal transduction histidine kinase/DNA-binding response OmpR family regulator|nr:ATP-binding protein [Candidatus Limnocylindrales bacterium]